MVVLIIHIRFSFLIWFKKKKTQASSFLLLSLNLFLLVLGLCCNVGLCLIVERRCYCPVLVQGLLIGVASFVVGPGL